MAGIIGSAVLDAFNYLFCRGPGRLSLMHVAGLISVLCSVGYAFINFEDVSRHFAKPTAER